MQNVIAPPRPKSKPAPRPKSSVESPTAASSSNVDVKLEKLPSIDERVHENGSSSHQYENDSVRSAPGSPVAKTAVESPSREFSDSHFSKTSGGDDASPHGKESQRYSPTVL